MDLEKLMSVLWKKYLETKDIKYLAEACEKAPFFGQKQMGKEISKILKKSVQLAIHLNFDPKFNKKFLKVEKMVRLFPPTLLQYLLKFYLKI